MRAHTLKEDRISSVTWARSLLDSGTFCVLDSETTGLTPPVEFVEIAIVDADARTLFEGTVRPGCRIEAGATRIHGHTARSLAGSPPFLEVYPDLLEASYGQGGSSSTTPPTTGEFGMRPLEVSGRVELSPESCLPGSAP